jgi:hypothetical protein
VSPSLIIVTGMALNGLASPIPASAESLIAEAKVQAAKEGKNIYVMFDGGQNEWARRHDVFLAKNADFFRQSFVTVRLKPFESTDPKFAPNPGAVEFLNKWEGARAGLPYIAILNAKGDLVGNSMYEHDNTRTNLGHPWTDPEVDAYMSLIKIGARRASKPGIVRLKESLKAQPGRGKQQVMI